MECHTPIAAILDPAAGAPVKNTCKASMFVPLSENYHWSQTAIYPVQNWILVFVFYIIFCQANVLPFHQKCTKPFHMHDVWDFLFPKQFFCLLATALAPLKFLHCGPRHTHIDVHKLGPSENLIDGSNTNRHYTITPLEPPPPPKKKRAQKGFKPLRFCHG